MRVVTGLLPMAVERVLNLPQRGCNRWRYPIARAIRAPMPDMSDFVNAAADLLGPRGWTQDAELVSPWLEDWRGRYHGRALGMASPENTAQVAALVRLCAQHGVPIVPQGGNSGMSGGATPDATGNAIILSLRRMNAIRQIDRASGTAVCEAGVILQNLHDAAEAQDMRFPLTLGGKGSATVGGLISTNAGGTQVLRHGTMRAQVLGLEAVMADGTVLDTLVPLKKDNRGFDLKQLLIGSEGTLGVVTAATLKLVPALSGRVVAWAGLPSITAARQLLLQCERDAADVLEGFEVMPDHCLQAVLSHQPSSRSPLAENHPWYALIELADGTADHDELVERAEALLTEGMEAGLVIDATIAASEAQADAFWLLRDSVAPAERAIGPAMQHDISVPVDRMAQFVEAAVPAVEQRFPGCCAVGFGHLGDGNIHFHVLAPPGAVREVWEESDGKAISVFVHDLVTEWHGSISAEHGIGQMKRDELGRLGDPAAIAVMQAVKAALDPKGILNPGKLVPLAPAATSP